LDQIRVDPCPQAAQAIGTAAVRGVDHDAHRAAERAQVAGDLHPVLVGQADVQQHQVERRTGPLAIQLERAAKPDRLETRRLQRRQKDPLAQLRVVLDHRQAQRGRSVVRCAGHDSGADSIASGRTASGLTFSIVCRSSRPRMILASLAQASRRWSNTSLLFWSSFTSPSWRSFWMNPRNRLLSKNSGAAGAYSRLSRCAASWHRLSSSPAPSVPGPFLASTEMAM